ncbi:hypothetical protein TNCV_4687961 [Trichonephila clavipes]|nr:hypothetical protein TNCV_4687961 [Trichonephila clavipes]
MRQINNYKNALPAGRLIPIVSNYPNEIVTLDLLGPYPVSRVRRNRYVLVITDHFSNCKRNNGETPAELFFCRKLITPFQKLVRVSDGAEFAAGDIERLFEDSRRNTKAMHEK